MMKWLALIVVVFCVFQFFGSAHSVKCLDCSGKDDCNNTCENTYCIFSLTQKNNYSDVSYRCTPIDEIDIPGNQSMTTDDYFNKCVNITYNGVYYERKICNDSDYCNSRCFVETSTETPEKSTATIVTISYFMLVTALLLIFV